MAGSDPSSSGQSSIIMPAHGEDAFAGITPDTPPRSAEAIARTAKKSLAQVSIPKKV